MTRKIFYSIGLAATVVLLCSLATIVGLLSDHFQGAQTEQLRDELDLAAVGTEAAGISFLEQLDGARFRLTWIDGEGVVRYDTQVPAADMGYHGDREEFLEAVQTGRGDSTRDSDTLTEQTVYEAVRLEDGSVLRISTSRDRASALFLVVLRQVLAIGALALVLAALLARRLARWIVAPLNRLDLEHPLDNQAYEEIDPLLRRINQQHQQIAHQLATLRRKTDEFDQITGHMTEGLVLLDGAGDVLSMNPAARALFGAEDSALGKSFLALDVGREVEEALAVAQETGRSTARAQRNGREYQFDLSRIQSEGRRVGAVVLAIDVTDRMNAERNRREFSANVSHELKSPLQSIIGSADLLGSGLVKGEDVPRFVGHIRTEAARLVALVEDIIRLSQLDEGVELPREEVDLLALAEEVAVTLQDAAERRGVVVRVTGSPCVVQGVRRLLYEIVYNLTENAIKYNREGGSVTLSVEQREGRPVLTVADTGIGIPPEHQDRVFERFYRVDKSHSKASGGTGLGLSIVKHAVQHHQAELELKSAPGAGTNVRVTF